MRVKRVSVAVAAACAAFALVVVAAPAGSSAVPQTAACSSGYVDAIVGGAHKCLHAGEFCSAASEADYERYGFACVDGHLRTGASAPAPAPATPTGVVPGATVLLHPRTRSAGCKVGALPDPRCTPGAYSAGLTKAVICSPTFRTSSIRDVSEATRHEVEQEYGLVPRSYGRTLEVDHLISLELGGSNSIANLFPEKLTYPNGQPGYRVKDRLENAAHDAVCSGRITLTYAQHQIAANWEVLYKKLFGVGA